MSIQSSINQMLSSITNDKLYGNIHKSLKNTETNIGDIIPQLNRLQKQVQHANRRNATERYKQAIAEGIAQNQRTPQLTPDNAPEKPKSEDTPSTVDETPQYFAVEASPEKQAQIDLLEKRYGNLEEAFKMAGIGEISIEDQRRLSDFFFGDNEDQIYEDYIRTVEATAEYESSIANTRVKMQQVSAQRTQENLAQRLQKSKAERSQAKQEFLKNKGGKHR